MAQRFFAQVLLIAEWQSLISDEYFIVDGTMTKARASIQGFTKKVAAGRRQAPRDATPLMAPHVAQKKHSAIDGRTTRHAGHAVNIKKRTLVEEMFGWSKTIGGPCKSRFVGLAKVRAQTTFTFAANNHDTHGDDLWPAFLGDGGSFVHGGRMNPSADPER